MTLLAGDEVGGKGEAIANNPDRVVAMREGKFDNEVHGYRPPRTSGKFERLE